MKKRITVLLQALISVGLLIWIFSRPEFRDQIWEVVAGADPRWLLAGFVVAGVASLLSVVRWNIFLRIQGIRLSFWDVFRISFLGLFFNCFMFGAVGGDVVKVLWLAARGHNKAAGLISVILDRMSGFPPLLAVSLLAMPWWLQWSRQIPELKPVPIFMIGYLGIVTLLLLGSMILTGSGWLDRLPMPSEDAPSLKERFQRRLQTQLCKVNAAFGLAVTSWRQSLLAVGLSMLVLLGHFSIFYCSARAFALQTPVLEFFAIMPVVDVIAALPVSLGGFGVREEVFVRMLAALEGVPAAQAVSISLGGAVLFMVWGLFGLILLPAYRRVVKEDETL